MSTSARPKASSSGSSSSSRPQVITIEDNSGEPAAASSSRVDPYYFSGTQWYKAFPFPGLPPVTEPFGFRTTDLTPAGLHSSVKSHLWSQDQTSLVKVEEDIPKLPGSAIVLDWHQVVGTDRITSRHTEWVDTGWQIPQRHRATLTELSHLCQQSERPIHLVICSHIESSSRSLENVIHATEQSGLPVQLVLITTQRTGPKGKLAALCSVISGKFCFFEDSLEITQEFSEASRPIAQVLKPRTRRSHLLRQECIGWSISSEALLSTAKQFMRYFSRSSA